MSRRLSQSCRFVGLFVVAVGLLASGAPELRAQMSPEEHASHHPDKAGEGDPADGESKPSGGMMGGGGGGGMMGGGGGKGKGTGGMMGEGMGHKVGGPGDPADHALFPTLMRMPDLPEDRRKEIEHRAHQRMKDGVELLMTGLDQLAREAVGSDFHAMQAGAETMREGLAVFESGLAANRALEEGEVPRNVALRWFRREMSLSGPTVSDAASGPLGLSWFHFNTMLLLVAFALGVTAMYFHKMRRASELVDRLASAKVAEPAVVAGPPPAAASAPATSSAAPPGPSGRWKGTLRVVGVYDESPTVKTFRLASPVGGALPFAFLPGQFLTIAVETSSGTKRRSYTIASSPGRGHACEITVARAEKGVVSGHLHEHVVVGDEVDISAPAGKFTFIGTESDAIVLLGGGVGVTPLMSVLRYLADIGWPGEVFFLFSVRSPREYLFRHELESLAKRHPNLCLVPTVTGQGGRWSGRRGRIDRALVEECVPDPTTRRFHVCGPNPMMAAMRSMLKDLGVPDDQVHTESFGGAPKASSKAAPAVAEPESPPVPAAAAPSTEPAATATVTFTRSGKHAALPADQTVLDVADDLGVEIDSSCRSGTCGTCVVKLVSGEVQMECDDGLSPEDKASGLVLACQAKSGGDVSVEA